MGDELIGYVDQMNDGDGRIVKQGSFIYDNAAKCRVKICQTDYRPGSGDHEDPPELREDVGGIFYQIWFQSAGGGQRFSAGGETCETLSDAIRIVEAKVGPVIWDQ
ncbi:MAG TPA: hypothetical protein VF773_16995 [Verrucomicrobiae bacterium]